MVGQCYSVTVVQWYTVQCTVSAVYRPPPGCGGVGVTCCSQSRPGTGAVQTWCEMCRPINYNRQPEVRRARKVVKKYRRMSLKKEMQRLRNILNADTSLPSEVVLDRTVELISELEARLISQIQDRGLPDKMAGIMGQMGVQWDSSIDMMREVVGHMMSSR